MPRINQFKGIRALAIFGVFLPRPCRRLRCLARVCAFLLGTYQLVLAVRPRKSVRNVCEIVKCGDVAVLCCYINPCRLDSILFFCNHQFR
jgi:hypothetical protein